MPAQTPPINDAATEALRQIGTGLRARRKALKISAVSAAESAGMSRVTWTRIEQGEPSVTIGAYLGAIHTLGLALELRDPSQPLATAAADAPLPERVPLDRYPQLRRLAWQQPEATTLTAREALALYERNWRHIDQQSLQPQERALMDALVKQLGAGRPLV